MRPIWIVNHYASDPAISATGSRHFSLSRHLHRMGWAPVIFAASSEHNSSNQRLKGGVNIGTAERAGVVFRLLRSPSYEGNGPRRVLNMVSFAFSLLRKPSVRGIELPSIVLGSTVHPLAALAAYRLSRRYRVPFIFEIRDLWPQTLIDMGKLSQHGFPAAVLRALERYLCNRAARVITLLPSASKYLESVGVAPEKVVWVSNGTDAKQFDSFAPLEREKFTFLYFGSMGHANGLDAIVDGYKLATENDPDSDSRLVLVGEGSEKLRLQKKAQETGLSHQVEFWDAVPKQDIPNIAAQADCLVLNLLDLSVYRFGISLNKLFDYMASARPIIIASNASNNPVRDADGGLCVEANNSAAIGDAMRAVMSATAAQRRVWSENAKRHALKNYDYEVLAAKLNSILLEVMDEFHSSRSAGRVGPK